MSMSNETRSPFPLSGASSCLSSGPTFYPASGSLFNNNVKWKCLSCSAVNEANQTVCQACLVKKGEETISVLNKPLDLGKWKCSRCYSKNPTNLLKCAACEYPKPVEWTCPSCSSVNAPGETKCCSCGKPKEEPRQNSPAVTFPTSTTAISDYSILFGRPAASDKSPSLGNQSPSLPVSGPAVIFAGCNDSARAFSSPGVSNSPGLGSGSSAEANDFPAMEIRSPMTTPIVTKEIERKVFSSAGGTPSATPASSVPYASSSHAPFGAFSAFDTSSDVEMSQESGTSQFPSFLVSTPPASDKKRSCSPRATSGERNNTETKRLRLSPISTPRVILSAPTTGERDSHQERIPMQDRWDSMHAVFPDQRTAVSTPGGLTQASPFYGVEFDASKQLRETAGSTFPGVSQDEDFQDHATRFSFGLPSKPEEALDLQPNDSLFTPTFGSAGALAMKPSTEQPPPSPVVGQKTETAPVVPVDEMVENVPDREREASAVGVVYTWGSGECDQLALRSDTLNELGAAPVPQIIARLRDQRVVRIACGALHSVALLDDGSIATWGCNDDLCLGRDTTEGQKIEKFPARVSGLPASDPVIAISCGDCHTAVLTGSGQCYAWGTYKDNNGYIGFPNFEDLESPATKVLSPVRVSSIQGRCVRLASGENHTAVLVIPDTVPVGTVGCSPDVPAMYPVLYVFGSNEFGQLFQPIPQQVDSENLKLKYLYPTALTSKKLSFIGPITNVFCGRATTFIEVRLGLESGTGTDCGTGRVSYHGVGRNCCGELGIGEINEAVDSPKEIVTFRDMDIRDIMSCQFASIALTGDGSVFTWGKPEYLGREAKENQTLPRRLKHLDKQIQKIGTGGDTMFAVKKNGVLLSWGEGQMYQLGDGLDYLDPVVSPVSVCPRNLNRSSVLEVAGGAQHSIALVFNGDYYSPPAVKEKDQEQEKDQDQEEDQEKEQEKEDRVFGVIQSRDCEFGKLLYEFIANRVQQFLSSFVLDEGRVTESPVTFRGKRRRTWPEPKRVSGTIRAIDGDTEMLDKEVQLVEEISQINGKRRKVYRTAAEASAPEEDEEQVDEPQMEASPVVEKERLETRPVVEKKRLQREASPTVDKKRLQKEASPVVEKKRLQKEASPVVEKKRLQKEASPVVEKRRLQKEASPVVEKKRRQREASPIVEKKTPQKEASPIVEKKRPQRGASPIVDKKRLQREASPVVDKKRLQREASPVVEKKRLQREASPSVDKKRLQREASPIVEKKRLQREASPVVVVERKYPSRRAKKARYEEVVAIESTDEENKQAGPDSTATRQRSSRTAKVQQATVEGTEKGQGGKAAKAAAAAIGKGRVTKRQGVEQEAARESKRSMKEKSPKRGDKKRERESDVEVEVPRNKRPVRACRKPIERASSSGRAEQARRKRDASSDARDRRKKVDVPIPAPKKRRAPETEDSSVEALPAKTRKGEKRQRCEPDKKARSKSPAQTRAKREK